MTPQEWQESDWHVSRAWPGDPDPFAPECGCKLLGCGCVSLNEANAGRCQQHSFEASKTIRSSHRASECGA